MIRILLILILISFYGLSIAQEESTAHEGDEHDEVTETESGEEKHFIALTFGYTYIPKGASLEATEREGFLVPTFGLDYFHVIGRRWELGVMLDWELDHYLIFDKELERERAFIATIVATHKLRNWHLQIGAGWEIEKNENLPVLRLGLERPFHLGNQWVLGPAVYFDIKEGYDTWSLSISIGKGF